MLINSDEACVIRDFPGFLCCNFFPFKCSNKTTLIITLATFCHNRQAVIADGAEGEVSSILGFCLQRKGREGTQGTSQTDSFGKSGRNISQGNSNHLF